MTNHIKLVQDFISDYKYQLKHNPDCWTNNKRRLHSYPLKRKSSRRLSKKAWHKIKHDQLFFSIIEEIIDKTLTYEYQKDYFNRFINFSNN